MIASRRASSSRFWGRSPPRMSEVFISLQLVQRVHHRVSSLPGAGPVGSCRWWHLFLVPAPELPQAVWRRPHSRVGRGKDTSDRSPDNFRYPDEKFPSSSPQGNPPARGVVGDVDNPRPTSIRCFNITKVSFVLGKVFQGCHDRGGNHGPNQ